MSARNDGGPAFPSHGTMGEVNQQGMSLRDHFAGLAMRECIVIANQRTPEGGKLTELFAKAAAYAYGAADAMLAQRDK